MDFGRPLTKSDGVAVRSNLRQVPLLETKNDDDNSLSKSDLLDAQVIRASNRAVRDMLGSSEVSCKDFPDYSQGHSPAVIREGDLVVIFESFQNLRFVYVKAGEMFQNRHGLFPHNSFLGKPFGSKIRSQNNQGYGFVVLLKPTPELWSKTLAHRTQIIQNLDASMICWHLDLRPNMIVCEAGTGSGALSHVLARTLAPYGHLHTHEFHPGRVERARVDFRSNGLSHLITVHCRDVCTTRIQQQADEQQQQEQPINEEEKPKAKEETTNLADSVQKQEDEESKDNNNNKKVPLGFAVENHVAHAVILDLPEPWWAITDAARVLKPHVGKLCSYSPCVEQSQRTVLELKEHGFYSIETFEFRLCEHFVDRVPLRAPPMHEKRPRVDPHDYQQYHSQQKQKQSNNEGGSSKKRAKTTNEKNNEEASNVGDERKLEASKREAATLNKKKDENNDKKRPVETMICTRPFPHMRGHTAFLTFATLGAVDMSL